MASPRCHKCIKARPGQRVVRGPDWWGGDEDRGSHYVGTVVSVCQPGRGSGYTTHPVEVQWDAGPRGYYRASCTRATCDLRLIDAGPTGVIFSNVTCGSCETKGVAGTRWKCANCADYNLCHSCYMSDKHNIEHGFLRYDDIDSEGFRVPSRKASNKFQFYGIFPGAEVHCRTEARTAIVGNVRGEARLVRKTDAGKLYYNTDKVDGSLKFYNVACGGYYYRDHMPAIALPGHDPKDIDLFQKHRKTMACNDNVQVIKEPGQLRRLYGFYVDFGIERLCGRAGFVEAINSYGVPLVSAGGVVSPFNPECLIPYHETSSSTTSQVSNICDIQGRDFSSGGKGLGYGLFKMTALHAACHSGQEDVVRTVVMAGVDLEEADTNGDRAVHYAAGSEQSRILEVLLNSGVDIGACNIFGETALHVAIKENSVDCASLLAKNIKESQINIQDNTGDTVLHSAIKAGMQQEIISRLLQVPTVNVAVKNDKGETPLHIAAFKSNLWATQQILENRTDIVDAKTKKNVTALCIAASNNLYEIARTLLTKGYTTVDAVRSQELKTALSIALERGHPKLVEVLVEAGIDLNREDANGNAPLHISLTNHHCEIVELLVKAGADVNKQDANGNTPLYISLMNHHCEIVELLVEAGADVNKQDANGNTPLHISLMSRRTIKPSEISSTTAPKLKAIATELENVSNGDIDTSLALACYFISSGSSLKLKNKEGLDPLNLAGTMPVLRTLLKWVPKKRASPEEEASVERSAEESTAVGGSSPRSAENTSGPVLSDDQKHSSSEKEEPKQEEIDDRHVCAICMERERTVAFLCGHGACQECSTKIQQCHVCRAPVEKIIKLYEG